MEESININDPVTVSVIIPTHNRPEALQKAVQSVLHQTFQDFEIIIIDDGSFPAITQEQISFDARIHLVRNEKAAGGSASRNRGIFLSRGKWLAFLDDDDCWKPQKLEQQLKLLAQHPHAKAASCAYTIHYAGFLTRHVLTPSHVSLAKLIENNCLGGASVCMADALTVKQVGGFNNQLKSSQDWDLWLKLRLAGDVVSVPLPLVDYFVHFKERISNNMQSKYRGARHFYFIYKKLMSAETKRLHLQFICYIKSRLPEFSRKSRLKHLRMALKQRSNKIKLAYLFTSLPRIFSKRL